MPRSRQLDPDFLVHADEIAGRLLAAGLDEAARQVCEAAEVGRRDPGRAAEMLHEAAAGIMAQVPAYSHRRTAL